MKLKLLFFFTLLSLTLNAQISQTERQALIDFYNATDGDNWTNNTNWDTDPNSTSDVNTWFGVTAGVTLGQKNVVSIRLPNNNLNGNIDFSLFPSKLLDINLSDNNLTGDFKNLSSLTDLGVIQFENLNLTGTIDESYFPSIIRTIFLSGNSGLMGTLDLSSKSNLTRFKTNNTGFSFVKLPSLVNITNINGLQVKDMPNLAYIEVPNPSVFYSLSSNYFDAGLRIVSYGEANNVHSVNVKEREFLKIIFPNSISTYLNSLQNGSTDTEWVEIKNVNGVARVTEIHANSSSINGPMPLQISAFTELKHLHVPSSGISSIATEIKNATKLEELYLNSNSISSIPAEFYDLVNLKVLNISNNQIPSLDNKLGDFTYLEQLYFSNNQVDLIPTTISNLKKLEKLEFANTKITLLPPQIGGLVELTRLVAAPNNIASIPTEFGQLTKLTYLDFASCQISNTPSAFANLTELETLYLNNNQLQVVAGLGGFTKLKHLRLHNNRLGEENPNFNTDLPSDLGDLVLLEELTLNNNKLTSLPASIGNLNLIKILPLQNNKLISLPSTIGGLSSLEELRLSAYNSSGNELTSLPSEIGNLSNLKLLYVGDNSLTGLPDEIGNLSNLEDLYIGENRTYNPSTGEYTYTLTTLPSTINNLTSLKTFRANNNHITGDVDLSNLLALTHIEFYENRITGLKVGGSPNRFPNGHFYFKNNPNLSCIEVPTSEVSNWEGSTSITNNIDNGVAFSDDCSGYKVPQLEREALIAFYNSTGGGTDWTGIFWDTDVNGLSNVGAWEGVTTGLINGQKHVIKIALYKNLNGFVPSEIKDLTELQELNIGYSSNSKGITELKPEIGQLSKLTRLDVSGHDLTSLPTEIGNLSSLKYLNVSNNELSSLPVGIGNFTMLEELHLEYQEIYDVNTGIRTKTLTTLPDEIGNIASLKKLYLQNNKLISLPSTIGGLSSLEVLNMERNQLTSLPSSVNNLTTLKEFLANNNLIEGYLNLENLTVLNRLKLGYNNISGLKINVAPTAFNIGSDNNSNTYYFGIKRNALGCVEVPSDELVSWQLSDANKENLSFIDNGVVFSDNCSAVTNNSIPDIEREALIAIYNSTSGISWNNDLSENSFYGVPWVADVSQKRNVGAWFGVTTAIINGQKHVTKVELNSNKLNGTIPSEIKNLTKLKELELNSNTVSSLPTEVGQLANLEQFTINSQYNSTINEYILKSIPSEINNITSLKRLDISTNAIEGNLDFSSLVNLTSLSVSSNQITGLKLGISPSVFDNAYQNGYTNSYSLQNQYINCIAVPQHTISDWQTTSFAVNYPNIVWGQDCNTYNNVPQGEIQALVDLYNNLNGTSWTYNENWRGNLAKASVNSPYNATKWYGVTTKIVDGSKHITSLYLNNNNLEGTVSSTIGNLTKLETLNLSSNKLTGSLPAETSNLSGLKTAYFQSNQLSGKLPDFTGITNLETLYISTNKFQFGDFENEFQHYKNNLRTFSYSSQAKVGVEEPKTFGTIGFTLEAVVSGTNNTYQWYKYGSPINGATNKILEITNATDADNGYYFCYVTNSVVTGLTIQTENVTMTYDAALSIDDESFSESFKLYPNPVENILQIRNSMDVKIDKIEIYTLLGKRVNTIIEPQKSIDISHLSKGIYLLSIITEKGKTTKRIVKK